MAHTRRYVIIGVTGQLGQALRRELHRRDHLCIGLARNDAEITADITDHARLTEVILDAEPDVVVNAAALINFVECDREPETAHRINAEAVEAIAGICRKLDRPFVHISTDQYFTGDGRTLHDEDAPVTLINEYARSKFAGETAARGYRNSLIIRTNFTGWRGRPDAPTFLEWAVNALRSGEEITAFNDFFTSTLDSPRCARAIIDMAEKGVTGLLNLGSRDVASKEEFLLLLAEELGCDRARIRTGSVSNLVPRRAESLGLDCGRIQNHLDWELPDTPSVVRALVESEPA